MYSPSLGRWLSNDPLGFNAGDQNWYRSIGNNPGNGNDPSGLILPLVALVGLGGSGLSGLGILGYERWLKGPIELERDNLHYKSLESYARIDPEGKYRKTLNQNKPTTLGDLKDDLIPGYKDEVKIARENGGTILEIAQSGYGYAVGAGLGGSSSFPGGNRPQNPISRPSGLPGPISNPLPIPQASNEKLKNLVRDLYKGANSPKPIGTGSTADAVRNEIISGLPTGGTFHSQKAEQYIKALEKWLRMNPNATNQDRLIAQSLLDDLKAALQGN